nr:arginase [Tissierella sp.]
MNINIIGVPLKYGCDRDGVEFGPDKLRELGIVEKLTSQRNKVYDMGNIFVPFVSKEDKFKDHPNMKYLNTIVDVNENLAHLVYSSLKGGSLPLIIGGDHALGMGSIAGASKFFKKIAVVWVDAHGDINDSASSPSGNIHGMPLAVSMDIGDSKLTNIYFQGEKVSPKDVYIIGARDLDEGEIKIAEDNKINLYTMDKIREKGLKDILNTVIESIRNSDVDAVHLSFDIDSLDKDLVPGTGTPVEGGFTLAEANTILETILREDFVKSIDFVELNPDLDYDKKTLDVCVELIETIGEFL